MDPTLNTLAGRGHDLRINLLLGMANWFVFLDHIPNNAVNLVTLRNYGFSGATDVFVFVAGYAVALIYGAMMLERGFVITTTRIFKRVGQLYVAYVVLFVVYVDAIGNVAARYAATSLFDEYNVTGIVDHPTRTLMHGLLLQARPLNLDGLQLFIVLMALFPPALWAVLRRPHLTLAASLGLYLAARQFDWGLPSFPAGRWDFNPFCWQLLFLLGAWFAVKGRELVAPLYGWPALRVAAVAYLMLALVIALPKHFPELGGIIPGLWPLSLDSKENLAPHRLLHFLALAFVFTSLVPRDWPALHAVALRPVIKCGEEWLAAFCAGVFLSFAAHFILITGPDSLAMQIAVSAAGLAAMTLVAAYVSWSKQQDRIRVMGAEA
ncbi:OpgC domain-containing protein [Bradyrhizobium sp.]|uniref:OpgC domain-containing protein n=1 Tax=Bradyrhizobium sp. TaxID=376 RepID=UPI001EBB16BC|nr:OpgC domain-containing protein [Bradyrhizobium sp.]MBV9980015.1 OpgC domain-containing protein [Bradyrhizobium sp.]